MNKKIIISLLLLFIIEIVIFTQSVNANSNETINISIEEDRVKESLIANDEEKIMAIDASTGETAEFQMDYDKVTSILEEMEQSGDFSTEAYIPNTYSYVSPSFFNATTTSSSNYTVYLSNQTISSQMTICKVISDSASGSGFLIGDNYMLTAAHCVMDEDGNIFDNLIAYPGYMNYTALASFGWNTIYYSSLYTTYGATSGYDWAIVEYDEGITDDIGWMAVTLYYTASNLNGTSVKSWGYPSSVSSGQYLCYSSGTISNAYSKYFNASNYVSAGMSGGPVRISDNTAVGINVAAYTDDNSLKAVRIYDDLFDLIVDLIN